VSIEFPLKDELTIYGPLTTPLIRLAYSTRYGWQDGWFLIDTGADFTAVPESLAEVVGIDLHRCPKESIMGIEGRLIPARVGSLTLLFGGEPLPIRCHFLKSERTPYLLGRMDIFSRFNIYFNNRARRVILTRL
jgi:predicted aspartyl protease